ncbi:MAG: hypothetical protein JXA33_26715 [Anaerolineae bacterium]|nr:hypothetical protein [Anaerolineae bacterium]
MLLSSQNNQYTKRDRLSILLAVTLSSAALFRFVELPTFTWGIRKIFGSPLNISLGGDWLLVLLMMGLVATGTLSLMQGHPLRAAQERLLIFSLITPTLGTLLVSLLLVRATLWPVWLGTLLGGGIVIGVLIHLNYQAFSPEGEGYASARTILNIIDYLIGFTLFSLVFSGQVRTLISGPILLLLTAFLSLDLLSASGASSSKVLLFGGIIALLEGELAWILGYWPISSWSMATILTLGLYLWSGICYQYLLGRLTRKIVWEFATVALLMFILVIIIRP